MPTDLAAILTASALLLGTVGVGIKWLLIRFEVRIGVGETAAKEARQKLEDRFSADIDRLGKELTEVRLTLIREQKLNAVYIRRIYQLENYIHSVPGLTIPTMTDWPPE